MMEIDPFIFRLSIFILSIFVGYYVVWSVTPSFTYFNVLTNAISSVIITGAIIIETWRIFLPLKYIWLSSYNFSGNKYFWWVFSNSKNVSNV